MSDVLTFAIVSMGFMTVVLSCYVAGAFFMHHRKIKDRDTKRLTRALYLMLLGEATIGIGTLAFALAQHTGHLPHWPVWFASALRATMFAATSITTAHLYICVTQLNQDR